MKFVDFNKYILVLENPCFITTSRKFQIFLWLFNKFKIAMIKTQGTALVYMPDRLKPH